MPIVWFAVPTNVYVTSPAADEPNLSGEYVHEGVRIEYRLAGAIPPFEVPTLPAHERYVKQCTELELTIHDAERLDLTSAIQTAGWPTLLDALVRIANRVLRGIRNFGTVPHISEIKPDLLQTERYLRSWRVSASDPAGELQRVFPEEELFGLLLLGGRAEIRAGEMDAFQWPDIVEAVQANLEPGPEQEFLTNAIEHLRLGNYRYALLEAIVCLEIVMTQFLRLFLRRKGLPPKRIDAFINPQLGPRARVAALLDLTLDRPLPPEYVDRVLTAVEWRNEVIHRSGHLPAGIPDEKRREGIASVLGLARTLALKREELEAEPDMRQIAQVLATEFGASFARLSPVLKARGQHRVLVDFSYLVPSAAPNEEHMRRHGDRVAELLEARDPGFNRNRHLLVRFVVLPNDVRARWAAGNLYVMANPPQSASSAGG